MENSEYWQNRALLIEERGFRKSEDYLKSLKDQYDKAIAGVEKDINNWYVRFADNNRITFQRANQMLNAKELKELKWDVEEYIKRGKENAIDQRWIKELENVSARAHISRLEALKLQMEQHVNELMKSETDGVTDVLSDIYEESYYRQIYDTQQGIGEAFTFSKLDTNGIEKVLKKPWAADGREFSERIWGTHRAELVNEVHTLLTQATIRGRNPKTLVKDIQKKFDVKRHRAETLCLTEAAHIRAQGQLDGFKASGVGEYEISAALDGRTCATCGAMDSKHFPVNKWQTAITAPPFHPRCRCATIPWFDDEFTVDETRIARDENGRSYTVENMSYSEWKEKFVDGVDISGESGIIETGGKYIIGGDKWQANQKRRDEKAAEVYPQIANADNVRAIARASGLSEDDVREIKNHVFFDKHETYEGIDVFKPDYDMAVAFKRLEKGEPEDRDILLLKHELYESQCEKKYGLTSAEAHAMARKKYDWQAVIEELNDGDGEEYGLL